MHTAGGVAELVGGRVVLTALGRRPGIGLQRLVLQVAVVHGDGLALPLGGIVIDDDDIARLRSGGAIGFVDDVLGVLAFENVDGGTAGGKFLPHPDELPDAIAPAAAVAAAIFQAVVEIILPPDAR